MKTCRKCGCSKDEEQFRARRNECRHCERIRAREWRRCNKEKASEYNKHYREEHKDKLSAYDKAYRDANRDRLVKFKRRYNAKRREPLKIYYMVHKLKTNYNGQYDKLQEWGRTKSRDFLYNIGYNSIDKDRMAERNKQFVGNIILVRGYNEVL